MHHATCTAARLLVILHPYADGMASPNSLRSLLQADSTCAVALEYTVVEATTSNFSTTFSVDNLSEASSGRHGTSK